MDGENPVIENIRSRRSIRSFKAQPISKELIEKIVEAGRFAPSSLNRQPWKFIIIDDNKLIEELSKIVRARLKILYNFIPILRLFSKELRDSRVVNAIKKTARSPEDTVFHNAPLVISIANDRRYSHTERDCCLAAQNMMLAAHSLGIGSCFVGRGRAIPKKVLLNRFNLPNFYDINIHLAFGYPKEFPKTIPKRNKDTDIWV